MKERKRRKTAQNSLTVAEVTTCRAADSTQFFEFALASVGGTAATQLSPGVDKESVILKKKKIIFPLYNIERQWPKGKKCVVT